MHHCYRSASEAYHAALSAGHKPEDFRRTWDVTEEVTHEHDGILISCGYVAIDEVTQ
jgi:hypothetical protein